MCGIAGYFCAEPSETPESTLIWSMVKYLHHRGPDAQDVYVQPGVALGHTRLSIIDLDARSNQPMVDKEAGCVITFNGEIYNYLELREELIALGHSFRTNSDTEVILKAYEQWGADCLNRFNGMWAFAIFDAKSGQIFAARDRFGIKPFVYGQRQNGDLVFASEAKSLVNVYPEFKKPNYYFLLNYIEAGSFAAYKDTFYQGLHNLLPGHYFIIKPGAQPQQHRYWVWQPLLKEKNPSDVEALAEFQRLLKDSIKLRFRSDVQVGSCLSGGVDSSTIVGLSTRMNEAQLSTFSCIYPNMPDVDESAYIQESVKLFKTDAHYTTPTFPNFMGLLRQCVWEQDGPTGGPSVLSQRAVMELAQGKVTVLLDGQGADEVLGGYHSYFPTSLSTYARDLRRKPGLSTFLAYRKATRAVRNRTRQKQPKLARLLGKVKKRPTFATKRFGASVLDYLHPYPDDDLNTLMLETLFISLSDLLHYEDRNSMAFSLESRLPFLDYRLVEYAFSLPHQFKIRNSQTKWLLTETAKGLLPNAVLNRKDKMGFTTPGQQWFTRPEAAYELDQYMLKPNILLDNMASKTKDSLQGAWKNLKKGQKINFGEETLLWRYFTSVVFLEQVHTVTADLPELKKEYVPA